MTNREYDTSKWRLIHLLTLRYRGVWNAELNREIISLENSIKEYFAAAKVSGANISNSK